MLKEHILSLLTNHKNELKKFSVKALYLFGSVARGEEGSQSDIDVLVSFEGQSTFDLYMDLKFYLEELFQRKVDLVTELGLRPELQKRIKGDLIRAA